MNYSALRLTLLAAFSLPSCWAQINHVTAVPPEKVYLRAGETKTVTVSFRLAKGYHVNNDKPTEAYMIPMRLTWNSGPLTASGIVYPEAHMAKFGFSTKPLAVVTSNFMLTTKFTAPANAPKGVRTLSGKLRYQACSDSLCFPPRNVDIQLPVEIR